jgi:hypothetical protein
MKYRRAGRQVGMPPQAGALGGAITVGMPDSSCAKRGPASALGTTLLGQRRLVTIKLVTANRSARTRAPQGRAWLNALWSAVSNTFRSVDKRTIKPIADRLDAAATDRDRTAGLFYDWTRKGEVGRARALAKLRKHFPLATITFPLRASCGRGCTLIDPKSHGEAQDAIIIRYGFAWIERKRELNGYEAFSIEVPDHATARLLHGAPTVNLPRVLMEAQDQFFAADVATVSRHVAHGTSLYLRACPGLLICEAISGRTPTGIEYWFARARTWISDSMIRPDQIPIAPAVGDDPYAHLDDGAGAPQPAAQG